MSSEKSTKKDWVLLEPDQKRIRWQVMVLRPLVKLRGYCGPDKTGVERNAESVSSESFRMNNSLGLRPHTLGHHGYLHIAN